MQLTIRHRSLTPWALLYFWALPAFSQTPPAAPPAPVSEVAEMLTQGVLSLDMRYRYEYVDEDNFDDEANASTLRSKVAFQSAVYEGVSFLAELSNVSYIGDDDFNSTENGETQYPVVADPDGTELNQAWARYIWKELSGIYGRQGIVYDDQRFIGDVAWRQNEQTYDGLRAGWISKAGVSLDYAYVYGVNRIFGPDDSNAQPSQWEGNNNLVRLEYKFLETQSIVGFAYLLDIDDRTRWLPNLTVNNSTDSYGIRYSGTFGAFAARASYAFQSNAGDSNLDYDANYFLTEGEANFFGVKGTLGYEVLGSDNGVGFKTPLATLHKFQGWADKFLVTPADGVEDAYIGVSGDVGPVNLAAIWHDFQSEKGSDDFGDELDLQATWPVNKMFTLQLKYAKFDGDDAAVYKDTQKAWLTVQFKI
jgi:Alginate export